MLARVGYWMLCVLCCVAVVSMIACRGNDVVSMLASRGNRHIQHFLSSPILISDICFLQPGTARYTQSPSYPCNSFTDTGNTAHHHHIHGAYTQSHPWCIYQVSNCIYQDSSRHTMTMLHMQSALLCAMCRLDPPSLHGPLATSPGVMDPFPVGASRLIRLHMRLQLSPQRSHHLPCTHQLPFSIRLLILTQLIAV